jgi:DNA-binding NarL/FixJ family response regulator
MPRLAVVGADDDLTAQVATALEAIADIAADDDEDAIDAILVVLVSDDDVAYLRDAIASDVPAIALYTEAFAETASRYTRRGLRGALAYDTALDDVAIALDAVAAGFVVVDPSLAAEPEAEGAIEPLTARERDVFAMLANGLGNRAIAQRLGISENTVKYHLNAIYGKLGVATRGEAVAAGARAGLVML